jgi:hypothetical protein
MSVKKVIVAIVVFGFVGVTFFLVERFILFNETEPKTEKELNNIADRKYHKEVGQTFDVNGVQFIVKNFTILKEHERVRLLLDISIQNRLVQDSSFQSSFFVLKDEADRIFLPEPEIIDVGNSQKNISLKYSLPEMKVGYLLYWLHLESPQRPSQKAIVRIYKSYRSEG